MSTARSNKEAEKANQELITSLKYKVKELEHEVSTLRGRLDDLRKAKNTTITKREREVVEVGFKRDPRYEAKLAELEKQIRDKSASKNREIEELKRKHAEELDAKTKIQKDLQKQLDELYQRLEKERKDLTDRLDKQKNTPACNHEDELYKLRTQVAELEGDKSALMLENKDLNERVNAFHLELSVKEAKWCEKEEQYKLKQKNTPACNHEDELYKLRMQVEELEGDKSALMSENNDLNERVNALHLELSVKEAQWCENEEQYKLKLKQQWGDKYEEWMAETERKIKELQDANQLLRMYLHRSGQRLPPEASGEGGS